MRTVVDADVLVAVGATSIIGGVESDNQVGVDAPSATGAYD